MKRTLGWYGWMVLILALSISAQTAAGKKILFVDSYHEGYPWSDGVWTGIQSVIKPSGATLDIIRMDTKRNPAEEFKKAAAAKVVAKIAEFKPDVVIASDDNAAKYVIVPNYKDKDLPFVFDGINWDASMYGFPCKNVTGMLEVSPMGSLIEMLKKYAKGTKVGFLASDNETNKKEASAIINKFKQPLDAVYVTKFDDWKKSFVDLQAKNDIVIIDVYEGIKDFNKDEALALVNSSTKVVTGSVYDFLAEFAVLSMTKIPAEQGEWAATTALQILNGKKIADIPVVQNKRFDIYANMKLAQKLGITFDVGLLKGAKIIK